MADRRIIDPKQVKQLHAKGLNDAQIGERLGFSRSGITRVRTQLGLSLNKTRRRMVGGPNIDPEQVKRLHAEVRSDAQISQLLKVSRQGVLKVRARLGLAAWSKSALAQAQEAQEAQVRAMLEKGDSYDRIAEVQGLNAVIVGNMAKGRGSERTLGCPRKYDPAAILDAHSAGLTSKQIAERIGCSDSRVRQVLREAQRRPHAVRPKAPPVRIRCAPAPPPARQDDRISGLIERFGVAFVQALVRVGPGKGQYAAFTRIARDHDRTLRQVEAAWHRVQAS